jgi:uncharacterized protein YjbI with pentapeptide repeats
MNAALRFGSLCGRRPKWAHHLHMKDFRRWLSARGTPPAQITARDRVREILGGAAEPTARQGRAGREKEIGERARRSLGILSFMANPVHVAKFKEGTKAWNMWRLDNRKAIIDLHCARLSGAHLREAHLHEADLSYASLLGANLGGTDLFKANLVEADLREADLRRAYLHEADLSYANLLAANLRNADLSETNLSGANLVEADLREANLCNSDLSRATLGRTIFANTNLSEAKGLESCMHSGPSSIGIDTFFQSRGEIPETFLRGCGVPEQFITFARSLVGTPIQFYSCFISYSTKDQEFADRLHADLQDKGVRCWFAPHDIRAGKKLDDQIDEAIRLYDRLLLVLSEHSMNSRWVKTEIAHARQKELNEGRKVLFPIGMVPYEKIQGKLFDAYVGDDSAREIREYFIPDFSNWKDHDSYQAAFLRLVRDLKAEEPTRVLRTGPQSFSNS